MEQNTLGTLGVTALSEGIKFLYAQAGEAIRWWRDRQGGKGASDQSIVVVAHENLQTSIESSAADPAIMDRLEREIRSLRTALSQYVDDVAAEPVNPADNELLAVTDALRRALEVVFRQPIRFRGESPAPNGPAISSEVEIDEVIGYAAAVRARSIERGHVTGTLRAGTVEGRAIGVDVDAIG